MGRYAFFDTGFEYKFIFGQQPSGDMLEFFGKSYYGFDIESLIHKWTKEDQVLIKQKLDNYFLNNLEIDKYENNLKGTYQLKEYLQNLNINNCYILGYLIYHQLNYATNLSVKYEL